MGNFEFKKKFGQNFLTDKNLLESIVDKAGVEKADVVLEIGAGKGALTAVLSQHAKRVVSFEVDSELFEFLTEQFSGLNVEFCFEDIMSISDSELDEKINSKFKLVANLPYYITSPIITRFLRNKNLISLTVMVQEEVADRIIAKPKTKDYGVLSVICQMFGEPQKVLRVHRKMFYPVPNVDSAVVKIEKKETEFNFDFDAFIAFVKKAFSMRRKKISTNLDCEKMPKQKIEEVLENLGFGASARAEELSIDDLKKLFFMFCDKK